MNKKSLLFALAVAVPCLLFQYFRTTASLKFPINIPMGQELPKGVMLQGFGDQEPWGRWTTEQSALIRFAKPLTGPIKLELTAKAFGPNAGTPIPIRCGKQTILLKFTDDTETREAICDQDVREIALTIPRPTSPHSLGLSPDSRSLGLGVVGIAIKSGGTL